MEMNSCGQRPLLLDIRKDIVTVSMAFPGPPTESCSALVSLAQYDIGSPRDRLAAASLVYAREGGSTTRKAIKSLLNKVWR